MIKIKLFAAFREITGKGELDWPLPDEGASAGQILNEIIAEYKDLARPSGAARVMVNRQYADRNTLVKPGDEVAFIPPVGGG